MKMPLSKLQSFELLRDKIKAGAAVQRDFLDMFPDARNFEHHYSFEAYGGDLNCALCFHDKMLGAKYWLAGLHEFSGGWSARIIPGDHIGKDEQPARAWLIAVFEAMIAKEKAQ
jgi:hypothetical protein